MKTHKFLWINLGRRKSCRRESGSGSKGPHCYGPCSHVAAGLSGCEVTERSEDQGEGNGPHCYGLSLRRRCVLHRRRKVAEGTSLSAPISLLIE